MQPEGFGHFVTPFQEQALGGPLVLTGAGLLQAISDNNVFQMEESWFTAIGEASGLDSSPASGLISPPNLGMEASFSFTDMLRKVAAVLDLLLPMVQRSTDPLFEILCQRQIEEEPVLLYSEALFDILLGALAKPESEFSADRDIACSLNVECAVFPPVSKVAAIPEDATARANSPEERILAGAATSPYLTNHTSVLPPRTSIWNEASASSSSAIQPLSSSGEPSLVTKSPVDLTVSKAFPDSPGLPLKHSSSAHSALENAKLSNSGASQEPVDKTALSTSSSSQPELSTAQSNMAVQSLMLAANAASEPAADITLISSATPTLLDTVVVEPGSTSGVTLEMPTNGASTFTDGSHDYSTTLPTLGPQQSMASQNLYVTNDIISLVTQTFSTSENQPVFIMPMWSISNEVNTFVAGANSNITLSAPTNESSSTISFAPGAQDKGDHLQYYQTEGPCSHTLNFQSLTLCSLVQLPTESKMAPKKDASLKVVIEKKQLPTSEASTEPALTNLNTVLSSVETGALVDFTPLTEKENTPLSAMWEHETNKGTVSMQNVTSVSSATPDKPRYSAEESSDISETHLAITPSQYLLFTPGVLVNRDTSSYSEPTIAPPTTATSTTAAEDVIEKRATFASVYDLLTLSTILPNIASSSSAEVTRTPSEAAVAITVSSFSADTPMYISTMEMSPSSDAHPVSPTKGGSATIDGKENYPTIVSTLVPMPHPLSPTKGGSTSTDELEKYPTIDPILVPKPRHLSPTKVGLATTDGEENYPTIVSTLSPKPHPLRPTEKESASTDGKDNYPNVFSTLMSKLRPLIPTKVSSASTDGKKNYPTIVPTKVPKQRPLSRTKWGSASTYRKQNYPTVVPTLGPKPRPLSPTKGASASIDGKENYPTSVSTLAPKQRPTSQTSYLTTHSGMKEANLSKAKYQSTSVVPTMAILKAVQTSGGRIGLSTPILQNPQDSVSVKQEEDINKNNSTSEATSTTAFNIDGRAQMKESLSAISGVPATSSATPFASLSNLSTVISPTRRRVSGNLTVKNRKAKNQRLQEWKNARKRRTGYKKYALSASNVQAGEHVSSPAGFSLATETHLYLYPMKAVAAALGLPVHEDSSAITWTSKEVSSTSAEAPQGIPENSTTHEHLYGQSALSTKLPKITLQSLTMVAIVNPEPAAATTEASPTTPTHVDIIVVEPSSSSASHSPMPTKDTSEATDEREKYSSLVPSLEKQQTIALQKSDAAPDFMSWQRENSTTSADQTMTVMPSTPTLTSGVSRSAQALQSPPGSSTVTRPEPDENNISTSSTNSILDSNIGPKEPKKAQLTTFNSATVTSAATTVSAPSNLSSVLSPTTRALEDLTVKPKKDKTIKESIWKFTSKRRKGYKINKSTASYSLAGEYFSLTVESSLATGSDVDLYPTEDVPAAPELPEHEESSAFISTSKEVSPTSAEDTQGLPDNSSTSAKMDGQPTLSTGLQSRTLQSSTVTTISNAGPAAATIETSSLTSQHMDITVEESITISAARSLVPVTEPPTSTDGQENYSSLVPSLEKERTIALQTPRATPDVMSWQGDNSTKSTDQSITTMSTMPTSTSGVSPSAQSLQTPLDSLTGIRPAPTVNKASTFTAHSIISTNFDLKIPKKNLLSAISVAADVSVQNSVRSPTVRSSSHTLAPVPEEATKIKIKSMHSTTSTLTSPKDETTLSASGASPISIKHVHKSESQASAVVTVEISQSALVHAMSRNSSTNSASIRAAHGHMNQTSTSTIVSVRPTRLSRTIDLAQILTTGTTRTSNGLPMTSDSTTTHKDIPLVETWSSSAGGPQMDRQRLSVSTDAKQNYSTLVPTPLKQEATALHFSFAISSSTVLAEENSPTSDYESMSTIPPMSVSTGSQASVTGSTHLVHDLQSPPDASTVTDPAPPNTSSTLLTSSTSDSEIAPETLTEESLGTITGDVDVSIQTSMRLPTVRSSSHTLAQVPEEATKTKFKSMHSTTSALTSPKEETTLSASGALPISRKHVHKSESQASTVVTVEISQNALVHAKSKNSSSTNSASVHAAQGHMNETSTSTTVYVRPTRLSRTINVAQILTTGTTRTAAGMTMTSDSSTTNKDISLMETWSSSVGGPQMHMKMLSASIDEKQNYSTLVPTPLKQEATASRKFTHI
ncbi:uncharacterized protein LOC144792133 [Lissotriton helveticus]